MLYFFVTLAVFLLMFLIMSIGYILQRKRISGSCGGLGSLGVDKACDCPEPCDKRKQRLAKEQALQANRIL